MPASYHYGLPRKTLHFNDLFHEMLGLLPIHLTLTVLFSVHYTRMPSASVHF
jgi:hypothetical protein